MAHLAKIFGSLILASTAFACAASDGDSGSSESGVTVTPTGSDHPGQLVVTVPDGVPVDGQTYGSGRESFQVDQQASLAMIARLPRTLSIGAHTLVEVAPAVPGFGLPGAGVGSVAFTIQNHALTTIALGGLSFHRSGTEGLVGIDVAGEDIWYDGAAHPAEGTLFNHDAGSERVSTISARIPGTYHHDFGLFDGFDTKVESAKLAAADLDDRTNRRQLRIVAPASRGLPDAACSGLNVRATRRGVGNSPSSSRSLSAPIGKPLVLPAGSAMVLGEYVDGAVETTYTNLLVPLPLVLGAVGAEPATLKLDRIDVTDVAVKQTDGSTVVARGSYSILQVTTVNGADVMTSICNASTNTGVDVGPGRYRVVVDYQTVEAGQKQDIHDITIP